MKTNKKRIFSVLLALLMMLSVQGTLAADVNFGNIVDNATQENDGYEYNSSNGNTITIGGQTNSLTGNGSQYAVHFTDANASVNILGDVTTGDIKADENLTIIGLGENTLVSTATTHLASGIEVDGKLTVNYVTVTGNGGDYATAGVKANTIEVVNGSLTGTSGSNIGGERHGIEATVITVDDYPYSQELLDAAIPTNKVPKGTSGQATGRVVVNPGSQSSIGAPTPRGISNADYAKSLWSLDPFHTVYGFVAKADGKDAVTLVTQMYCNGQSQPGVNVLYTIQRGNTTETQVVTTDSEGCATLAFSATEPGVYTITASSMGTSVSTKVLIIDGTVGVTATYGSQAYALTGGRGHGNSLSLYAGDASASLAESILNGLSLKNFTVDGEEIPRYPVNMYLEADALSPEQTEKLIDKGMYFVTVQQADGTDKGYLITHNI